ncbi:MAG: hypothetical protein FJ290_23015 [Planctomycetes bacterium]|nr:hypothetical protein [Planctomycetota bacterium]
MRQDWRELLDRALEGEALSAPEAEALAAALGGTERREEALALVCLEGCLRERLAPAQGVVRSRERLLAKAVLREKGRRVRAGRGRLPRWRVAAAAAAAMLLAALGWLLTRGTGGYPEPEARGDYRLLGSASAGLARGERLAVGPGGAELRLGGYCRLALDPNTEVVVRGGERREAVELERGRVVSEVEPRRGGFTLLTPRGHIEVKGTKFLTSVEYPESQKGERDMGKLRKSSVVTVVVVAGIVACHFGGVTELGPGMSQVFAGHDETRATLPPELKGFKGILVGTIVSEVSREFLLKIDKIATVWPQSRAERPEGAVGKKVEVVVGQNRMLEQHMQTLKTLRKGDQVIVEAFDVQGFRLTVMELFRKAEESGERREGEGEVREKRPHGEGEGEVREKKPHREGEGEVREKKPHREGEGEVREKKPHREGEGEWREKKTEPHEGEGEVREKKTEPRAEGLREMTGWVKATPDRDCAGILKVVERVETDAGVREKVTVYRILSEGKGRKLVEEASGRRVRLAGLVTPGEGGVEPGLVVKEFRVLDAPDQPKREKREGEGEVREKKTEHREGEGEVREKKTERRDGEGEWREKKVERRDGEGEWREKKTERRDGEGEGEGREKRTEGEDAPKPRVEAGGVATAEAVAGFRGMLEGTVVGKTGDALILRVEKINKVWQSNTCKAPEALVGKLVSLSLKYEPNPPEALATALAALKAGDRVLAGATHREGKFVSLVEVLRKIEAE